MTYKQRLILRWIVRVAIIAAIIQVVAYTAFAEGPNLGRTATMEWDEPEGGFDPGNKGNEAWGYEIYIDAHNPPLTVFDNKTYTAGHQTKAVAFPTALDGQLYAAVSAVYGVPDGSGGIEYRRSEKSNVFPFMVAAVDPDTQAPTGPQYLNVTTLSDTEIRLEWDATVDDSGYVAGYRVYRDDVQLVDTTTPNYTDSGLAKNTEYTYKVQAFDASHNYSSFSHVVSSTTLAAPPNPNPHFLLPLPATPITSTQAFTWSYGDVENITHFWFWVGTCQEDGSSPDCVSSLHDTNGVVSDTVIQVEGLPQDGSQIWVNIWWQVGGSGQGTNGQYGYMSAPYTTAVPSTSILPPVAPVLTPVVTFP